MQMQKTILVAILLLICSSALCKPVVQSVKCVSCQRKGASNALVSLYDDMTPCGHRCCDECYKSDISKSPRGRRCAICLIPAGGYPEIENVEERVQEMFRGEDIDSVKAQELAVLALTGRPDEVDEFLQQNYQHPSSLSPKVLLDIVRTTAETGGSYRMVKVMVDFAQTQGMPNADDFKLYHWMTMRMRGRN